MDPSRYLLLAYRIVRRVSAGDHHLHIRHPWQSKTAPAPSPVCQRLYSKNMAIPGQRFELDLEADDFAINPIDESSLTEPFRIKDVQEHDSSDVPAPPKPKASGFPEHKQRKVSRFRQKQEQTRQHGARDVTQRGPSDAAIAHNLSQRNATNDESSQKAEISRENDQRIASMSAEDIGDARAEIMGMLSPALIEQLLKRSRIDDPPTEPADPTVAGTETQLQDTPPSKAHVEKKVAFSEEEDDESMSRSQSQALQPLSESPNTAPTTENSSGVHFPAPPRSASDYRELDPNSPTFLSDLKATYFPELAHKPSPTALEWLQPSSGQDREASSYSPALESYPASSIRFDFRGRLIPPNKSLELPANLGLHHHGEAPDSAGYTIPELTLLARSTLPNQRCIAYQSLGRLLYRLGKEEFGRRGSEMYEALWALIEKERVLELVMAEAGKDSGHASARAYATEALWLWRKGSNGERGLHKSTAKMAI